MSKLTKAQIAERDEARATLRELLKPGDTVLCVLRHVARSGMSRDIDFFTTDHRYLTSLIARACDYRMSKGQGLKVGGCGMDMGFAVVYDLGCRLWPNGTDKPHGTRNGVPDSEGGYALKSSWL